MPEFVDATASVAPKPEFQKNRYLCGRNSGTTRDESDRTTYSSEKPDLIFTVIVESWTSALLGNAFIWWALVANVKRKLLASGPLLFLQLLLFFYGGSVKARFRKRNDLI
jgi:hypothetical protein